MRALTLRANCDLPVSRELKEGAPLYFILLIEEFSTFGSQIRRQSFVLHSGFCTDLMMVFMRNKFCFPPDRSPESDSQKPF